MAASDCSKIQAPGRPPRQRSSSTRQRGGPKPMSSGGGVLGDAPTRQRLSEAEPDTVRTAPARPP
jgi:hypothetical protein